MVRAERGSAAVRLRGTWTPWRGVRGPKSAPVEGNHELFGFLTTEANAVIAPIHPKAMPVILRSGKEADRWLEAETADALALLSRRACAVRDGKRCDLMGSTIRSGSFRNVIDRSWNCDEPACPPRQRLHSAPCRERMTPRERRAYGKVKKSREGPGSTNWSSSAANQAGVGAGPQRPSSSSNRRTVSATDCRRKRGFPRVQYLRLT